MTKPLGCAECLHADLIQYEKDITELKKKFSKQASIAGWEEFAIIKCSCESGYAWRPVQHPDVKEYGAIEYCICNI